MKYTPFNNAEVEETLKWGEPAYITSETKSGSTIRIDSKDPGNGIYAMYFNCKTNLISSFKQLYPEEFSYEGNRAIIFNTEKKVPEKELAHCISLALTYHQSKKQNKLR